MKDEKKQNESDAWEVKEWNKNKRGNKMWENWMRKTLKQVRVLQMAME